MIVLFPTCITQDATVLLVALHIVTLTRGSATVSLVWWEPTVTAVRYVYSFVLSLSSVLSQRLIVIKFCLFRMGHLALIYALVAVSVIAMQQRL